MIIDCASCVARPTECGDCVVTVVLGSHPGGIELDADEQTAVAVLAGSGLVPPLRLMSVSAGSAESGRESGRSGDVMQAPATMSAMRWSRRPRAG